MVGKGGCTARERLTRLPEHEADEIEPVELGERTGGDVTAIAQDGDTIADREERVEAMADVDHRRALRLERADEPIEQRDLSLGQGAGGLVENEHFRT